MILLKVYMMQFDRFKKMQMMLIKLLQLLLKYQ